VALNGITGMVALALLARLLWTVDRAGSASA